MPRSQVRGAESCLRHKSQHAHRSWAVATETEGRIVKLSPIATRTTVGGDTGEERPGKISITFLAILDSSTFALTIKEGS